MSIYVLWASVALAYGWLEVSRKGLAQKIKVKERKQKRIIYSFLTESCHKNVTESYIHKSFDQNGPSNKSMRPIGQPSKNI